MALFIRTGAHVRKTYYPRDIYLSRLAYLCHTCLRLKNCEKDFLLEASDQISQGITDLSTLSFSAAEDKTPPAPLRNVAKLAQTVQDLQDASEDSGTSFASENEATDDHAHGNGPKDEEADPEKEDDESLCSEVEKAEKAVDADLIQMKTLRATTSTHDDWLHRGPYLHGIAFHTYAEYIDRVRLPRHAPAEEQIFPPSLTTP